MYVYVHIYEYVCMHMYVYVVCAYVHMCSIYHHLATKFYTQNISCGMHVYKCNDPHDERGSWIKKKISSEALISQGAWDTYRNYAWALDPYYFKFVCTWKCVYVCCVHVYWHSFYHIVHVYHVLWAFNNSTNSMKCFVFIHDN